MTLERSPMRMVLKSGLCVPLHTGRLPDGVAAEGLGTR